MPSLKTIHLQCRMCGGTDTKLFPSGNGLLIRQFFVLFLIYNKKSTKLEELDVFPFEVLKKVRFF